jgi:hypothetical protein
VNETGIVVSVACFLGGSLLTVILFIIPFVGRLAKVETAITNLAREMGKIENIKLPCVDHVSMRSDIAVHTEQLRKIEGRMAGKL